MSQQRPPYQPQSRPPQQQTGGGGGQYAPRPAPRTVPQSEWPPLRVEHPEWFMDRDGKQFILYAGLLALGHSKGIDGISTTLVQVPSELNGMTAIAHASVHIKGIDHPFDGIGDASPLNVNRMMVTAIIRMAETRAKARALRDAVNIGMAALEELAPSGPAGDDDEPRSFGSTRALSDAREAPPVKSNSGAGAAPRRLAPENVSRPAPPPPDDDDDQAGPDGPLPPDVEDFTSGPNYDESGPRSAPPAGRVQIGFGNSGAEGGGPGSPATPKQLQTIARMARASGKSVETEGISRAQASEIISGLIQEMGTLRAT